MRTLKALLVTAVAVSILTPMSKAEAVTYVDVQANDVTVAGDNCGDVIIDAFGDWSNDVHNDIDLTVHDPNGTMNDSDSFSDDPDGAVRHFSTLCGWDLAGTYDVEVVVTGYDSDFNVTSSASGATTFEFSKAAKKNSQLVAERDRINQGGYKWLVAGKLTRAGKKYRHQSVCLEAKSEGTWIEIECFNTNRRGLVAWKFKPSPYTWHFKYQGNDTTKAATSKTFRTPTVGNAKLAVTAEVSRQDVVRR